MPGSRYLVLFSLRIFVTGMFLINNSAFAFRNFSPYSSLSEFEKRQVTCPGADLAWNAPQNEKDLAFAGREELHKKIIASFLKGKEAHSNEHVVLLLGLPGSGKTTVARKKIQEEFSSVHFEQHVVTLSVDDIMLQLPEFNNGVHFEEVLKATGKTIEPTSIMEAYDKCANEAFYIQEKIKSQAMSYRYDILLEATGSSLISYADYFENASNASITLLWVDVPVDEAISRVKTRAEEEGRMVDEGYIRDIAIKIPITYEQIKQKLKRNPSIHKLELIKCQNNGPKGSVATCVVDNE